MKASEFFQKGKYYKWLKDNNHYFTKGKVYKSYGIQTEINRIINSQYTWNVLETNKSIGLYDYDRKANGLGDAWFNDEVNKYFELVCEKKNHLPAWW